MILKKNENLKGAVKKFNFLKFQRKYNVLSGLQKSIEAKLMGTKQTHWLNELFTETYEKSLHLYSLQSHNKLS